MTHYLVTGGAGFIGSHVCERLLLQGDRVTVLDDLNPFYNPALKHANLATLTERGGSRFEFVETDISVRTSVDRALAGRKLDQVIHLAARAGVRPSLLEPALYQRVNVEGTVNLLEAARTAGCRKFILASSSSVYGVNAKVPFAENDPVAARPHGQTGANIVIGASAAHRRRHRPQRAILRYRPLADMLTQLGAAQPAPRRQQ